MEQAQSEKSGLGSGEGANATAPRPPASSTPVKQPEANEAKRALPSRRKLSDEQEGEMTRLYADTTMPVSEIARKYGIGESSVYRLAQRHGAALRGRQTTPGMPPPKPPAVATVLGRFRIRFLVERVVQAPDIRDALRQAESFDAIEVTAVMHED